MAAPAVDSVQADQKVPIVVEKDGICQITNRLGENAPHVQTWLAAKTQTQPHEEDFGFREHGAGLRCRCCVEMHLSEGRFVIDLRYQYGRFG